MTITVTAQGKKFNFPDGTTQEQMGEAVDSFFQNKAQSMQGNTNERSIPETVMGGVSGAATLASDIVGTGAGGLTALVDMLNPFTDNDPKQLIEQVKSKFQINPTEGGEAALNQMAKAIEPAKPIIDAVSDFKKKAGQQGLDLTGSPAFATFVNIIPDMIAEVSGAGLGKRAASASPVLDPTKNQTKNLAKKLAAADIASADKATGITRLTSDIIPPETRLGKLMQTQGELVAGFQRSGQQGQRVGAIQKLAEKYDLMEGTGFEAKIVEGLKNSVQESKKAIGKLYDESTAKLDKLGNVPLTKTKEFAQDVIDREAKKGSRLDQTVIDDMQSLVDAPEDLSFELIKEIRSGVGANLEKVRRGAPVQGNSSTSLLKRTYDRLTNDMTDFANNADSNLSNNWKKANKVVSEFTQGTSKRGVKSVIKSGDATPEDIDKLLFSGKGSDVEFLANNLDVAGKNSAKQRVLQRALEKSSIDGDDINPNKFLGQLNKTSSQINKIFSGEEKKALLALREQLSKTRRAQEASVTTPTGQQLTLAAAMALPATLIPGILTGIVESKPVRNLLIKRNAAKSAREVKTIDDKLKSKIDELGLAGALGAGAAITQENNNE